MRVGEGEIAVDDWETVVGDDWDTGGLVVEAEERVGDSTFDCLDTKTCFDTSIRDRGTLIGESLFSVNI